jgi:hypothetical protein
MDEGEAKIFYVFLGITNLGLTYPLLGVLKGGAYGTLSCLSLSLMEAGPDSQVSVSLACPVQRASFL